jgi:hypothetical protein
LMAMASPSIVLSLPLIMLEPASINLPWW